MTDIEGLWKRFEAVAQSKGSSLQLRAGASESAVSAAEATLGFRLPEDYRTSVLLHDGQEGDEPFPWLPGCSPLKSIDEVVERWTEEQGLISDDAGEATEDGPLYTVLWHPRRVPIAGNAWWDGDNTYVDLHPTPAGTEGQIITFVTECDLVCLGPSFASALEMYVDALERGWTAERGDHPANRWAKYAKRGPRRPRAKPSSPAASSTPARSTPKSRSKSASSKASTKAAKAPKSSTSKASLKSRTKSRASRSSPKSRASSSKRAR